MPKHLQRYVGSLGRGLTRCFTRARAGLDSNQHQLLRYQAGASPLTHRGTPRAPISYQFIAILESRCDGDSGVAKLNGF